jgi:hypothetical protein
MGGVVKMKKTKKIEITISNEKLELLRKMGLTPEDVFSQGFEMLLRRKYRESSMIEDEDDDELDIIDINEVPRQFNNIDEFIVNDNNISNN